MNNEDKITYVKSIIDDFDNLVKDKEKLNNELLRLQTMLSESNKIIQKLNQLEIDDHVYGKLVDEIAKQRSYINTINEIATNFNKVDKEISKYDSSKLEKINDYIIMAGEFNRLCEEIKIAEKLSKKSNEQKMETFNAEGRKKLIDVDLIDYYKELVAKKKQISKQVLNNYKIINDLDVDELIVSKTIQENISYETIVPKKEYDPETVIKNMTLDDRIRDVEDRIQRIINISYMPKQGKKRYVEYAGQHYSIPVKYIGRFNNLKGELNKLIKIKKDEEIEKNEQVVEHKDNYVEEKTEVVDFDKQFDKIMQDISNIKQRIIEDRNLVLAEQEALYNISHSNMDLNNEMNVIEENKNSSEKIIPIQKVKIENDIVKKVKKVAITAAAVATVAVTAISGLNIFKSKENKNNKKDIDKQVTYENDGTLEEIVNAGVNNSVIMKNSEVIVSVPENEILPKNEIMLNEQILIEEGSEIYKTSHDATNQINGLNPYYGYSAAKNVVGVTIQMPDGSLINLKNYDAQQIQTLINQGGQVTAYLTGTQNENGTYDYEGYYHVDDIEKESGGKSR